MLRRSVFRRFANVFELEDLAAEIAKAEVTSGAITPKAHLYAKPLPRDFKLSIAEHQFSRPPTLKHGLERLVRTRGIYPVDEMSTFTGNNFLKTILSPSAEILKKFPAYTPPSQDKALLATAVKENMRFVTGSSSITEELTHIYYLLSNFKSPDMTGLAKNYDHKNLNFMSAYRKPTTFMLRRLTPDIYSIDGDSGLVPELNKDLSDMGVVLEAMLTTDESTYRRICDPKSGITKEEIADVLSGGRSHKMRTMGDLLIRSQMDCESMDESGRYFIFEIKTRATAPLRYDVKNIPLYLDYRVTKRSGATESYELEYFDLIRSILIKYYFQIKIGNMDGAFICFHNTKEVFGFQYLTLAEIEKRVFGCKELGEFVLKTTIQIHQLVLKEVLKLFPEDNILRIGYFSNYRKDEMLITVEQFDKQFAWGENTSYVEGIEDEHDYYNIFEPGKTAYTLRLQLFPYLNGILQREPLFYEPGDKLEICYSLDKKGYMPFEEYMYFLHNAYKFESQTYYKDYIGVWKKYNDFHVFRKPRFRLSL